MEEIKGGYAAIRAGEIDGLVRALSDKEITFRAARTYFAAKAAIAARTA